MKAQLAVFAMTAILIVGIGTAPAFGQILGAIDVSTDKESYMTGDTIVVSGTIRDNYGGAIGMKITAPNGNIVALGQLTPTADKTYQTEVAIGGIFNDDGTYTVEVTYGSGERTASTTFEVDVIAQDTMEQEPTPVDTPSVFMIEGVEDGIQYSITGGTLENIILSPDTNSLIVMIEAIDDGSLTMTIPKTILKAEENGLDTGVIAIIDDTEEANFLEEITENDRTLILEFSAGAEKIEIIGTWVIPEFGVIAAMILAVAIVSIIAISAKSRLSIIPRY